MADRTCPKCGKKFAHPCRLKAHLARKTPCDTILEHENIKEEDKKKPYSCKFCGRRYNSTQGLSRHLRKCQILTKPEGMDILYEHFVTRREKEDSQIEKRVEGLENKLDKLDMAAADARAGGSMYVEQHINFNPNIQINVFGQEAIDHIGREMIREILDSALKTEPNVSKAALMALIKTAMMIYSDPDHPENMTCYLPKMLDDEVMVHVGGESGAEWVLQPCQDVLNPMVARSLDTLVDNQPFENANSYSVVMRMLLDEEDAYKKRQDLRLVLVHNHSTIEKALYKKKMILAAQKQQRTIDMTGFKSLRDTKKN